LFLDHVSGEISDEPQYGCKALIKAVNEIESFSLQASTSLRMGNILPNHIAVDELDHRCLLKSGKNMVEKLDRLRRRVSTFNSSDSAVLRTRRAVHADQRKFVNFIGAARNFQDKSFIDKASLIYEGSVTRKCNSMRWCTCRKKIYRESNS